VLENETEVLMRDEQKESFRKWTTFVVSTGALLVACLRDPLSLTFRATVQEVLRQELAKNQPPAGTETKADKRLESEKEFLKVLDGDLRERISMTEANNRLLVQLSNHLALMEMKLDLLRGYQREVPLTGGLRGAD
jgi:hypothetical protein